MTMFLRLKTIFSTLSNSCSFIPEMTASAGGCFGEVKIKGISLNTFHLSPEAATAAIETVTQETGLFCTDAVRFGAQGLLSAIYA
jgi:uncharacterized NAD-dependent epimerase/dehydratase family protein